MFCLLAALAVGLLTRPAVAQKTPSVLLAGGCGFEVARKLSAAGFALDACSAPEETPLTWDRLKRFNVVVVEGLGRANADMSLSRVNLETLEALRRFMDAGGGVLFIPSFGQMATQKPPEDALLKPLGLTPLFEEWAFDPPGSVVATPWKIPFARAVPVGPPPLIDGVRTVWYPAPSNRIGGQNHNLPFSHDGHWSIFLTGSPSSFTRSGPLQADPPTQPGRYGSSVPLAARKEAGKGRIIYLGITPEYLFGTYATTTLAGVVTDRGLQGAPSDGLRLVENALRWLAAPSLAQGDLGGAPAKRALEENPYRTRLGTPYSWPEVAQFPAVEPAYPGVIGARSSYSGGRATVEEWVSGARARGLAFLVFLEDFPHLTKGSFEKLKADCARLSSKVFTAIPGIAIDDEIGNHYFYFGTTFPYPDKQFLSPDGTKLVSHDPQLDLKDPYRKGQLAMTTLDYAYSLGSFRLTAGNYLLCRSPVPFADWFSDWDAFGVISADGGRVLEDATQSYLKLVDVGEGPLPLVIDRMDEPAQLDNSKWRTVLRLPERGGSIIGQQLGAETKIADYFNEWHHYPDNPSKIYVTSGPEIETWRYTGPRDYEGNTPGDFVWQNYRWLLNGRVKSSAGLREVDVYDGESLLRRYLPGGKMAFEFNMDLCHDRQHNLVVIATDEHGGRAISGEQWDRNHRLEEFMCGDRNNQLSYGYLTNRDGLGLLLGGNQSLATPYKRIANGISPAGAFKNDALLGAPAFDGAAGGEPEVWESVALIGATGELPAPNVSESRRLMHTRDVHIGEGRRERIFSDGVGVYNVWHTLWRTQPAADYTVTRRNHFFQVDPDSPLACFLWTIDIRLKRDLPNRGFRIGALQSREDQRWMVRATDGAAYFGEWDAGKAQELEVPFDRNACCALLDSPLGGAIVFPLSDGLRLRMRTSARNSPEVLLRADSAPHRAGETRRVSLLLVGIPRQTPYARALPADSRQTVDRFLRELGLDGGKAGYTVTPRAGKVTGRRYILDVDGGVGRCFSGRIDGRVISSLPIRVSGINDRWSCYLYDRRAGKARPIGAFEGRAWATVALTGSDDLFIGHPVTASDPSLALQVTQIAEDRWRIEAHNPTDRPIRAALKLNPWFDPFRGASLSNRAMMLRPGGSLWVDVRTQPHQGRAQARKNLYESIDHASRDDAGSRGRRGHG